MRQRVSRHARMSIAVCQRGGQLDVALSYRTWDCSILMNRVEHKGNEQRCSTVTVFLAAEKPVSTNTVE